jgi:hypothetical protein
MTYGCCPIVETDAITSAIVVQILASLGLSTSVSWLSTIGFAVAWLALILAYSPLADRLATRWVDKPPTLDAFRALQQSGSKLLIGIVVAWVLGGFLEELIFRGIILQSIEALASAWLVAPMATGAAVCTAAVGAGLSHLYQGLRAVIIVTQLSVEADGELGFDAGCKPAASRQRRQEGLDASEHVAGVDMQHSHRFSSAPHRALRKSVSVRAPCARDRSDPARFCARPRPVATLADRHRIVDGSNRPAPQRHPARPR